MNENPEIASAWKGRVLVQVCSEVTEKPKCMKRRITELRVLERA